MKKLLAFFAVISVVGPVSAAVQVVKNTDWGTLERPDEALGYMRTSVDKADDFSTKSAFVDIKNDDAHTGDNTIAFIAKKIVSNGGCFVPVDIFCEHQSGDRYNSHIKYYQPKNTPAGDDCIWLCSNGYSGAGCESRSTSSTKINWWALDADKRKTLGFVGITPDSIRATDVGNHGIDVFDSWNLETSFWGEDEGFAHQSHIVLGITKFLNNGVEASPVALSCWGDREGLRHFHGIGRHKEKLGNTKLLCPAGYQPNKSNTDCIEVIGDSNDNTPKTTEMTPDGSSVTYSKDVNIELINALKANPKYNPVIHSIYNYTGDDKNPKFGIFCKDTSTGLDSQSTLNCIECTANLRCGVCLENNPGFGLCTTCGTGKIYDTQRCICVDAMAYSMTDLAYGRGNQPKSGTDACWAIENNDDYRDCVTGNAVK